MSRLMLTALLVLVAACTSDEPARPPAASFTVQVEALARESNDTAEPVAIDAIVEDSSEIDEPVVLQ